MLYRVHDSQVKNANDYGEFQGYIRLCGHAPGLIVGADEIIDRFCTANIAILDPDRTRVLNGYPLGTSLLYTYTIQIVARNQWINRYYLHPVEPIVEQKPVEPAWAPPTFPGFYTNISSSTGPYITIQTNSIPGWFQAYNPGGNNGNNR